MNTVINLLKWPTIVALLLMASGLVDAMQILASNMASNPSPYLWLLSGIIGYILLHYIVLSNIKVTNFIGTFEHELTHAIFALLTFNRVTKFVVWWNKGGYIQHEGKGNWIIYLSPYFVPTVSILYLLTIVSFESMRPSGVWLIIVYGMTIGYQYLSTYIETHPEQTDFLRAGKLFSIISLPPLNILIIVILLYATPDNNLSVSQAISHITFDVKELLVDNYGQHWSNLLAWLKIA